MDKYKQIGIMGGTFDPVHFGHLFAAEAARDSFNLDHVMFLPVGNPPHKQGRMITSTHHRLRMLELAVAGNPGFSVSLLETMRPGISYTIDTLLALRGLHPAASLYFIIGGDTLLELEGWKRFDEIAALCSFIVYHRPGIHHGAALQQVERLKGSYRARISLLEGPRLDISSSDIRSRVSKGKPIRYLVPDGVKEYIEKFQLYMGVNDFGE
jgi:nicotinate-nucleotide adenylyltransferase